MTRGRIFGPGTRLMPHQWGGIPNEWRLGAATIEIQSSQDVVVESVENRSKGLSVKDGSTSES